MTAVVVASENALRTAIQRTLLELARTGRFYRVIYDADGFPAAIDPDTAVREEPKTVIVNEIDAEFQPDTAFGRSVYQRRTAWRFELHLGFDREVTVSFFEQDAIAPVPRVDKTQDHTFALLRLVNVQYDHPARDGSAGGSVFVLTWEAQIGR
jgi:hypothetical protein